MDKKEVLNVMMDLITESFSEVLLSEDRSRSYDRIEIDKGNKHELDRLQKLSDLLGIAKNAVDGYISSIKHLYQTDKLIMQIQTLKNNQNETK